MSLSIKELYILDYFYNRPIEEKVSEYRVSQFGNDYYPLLQKLILNGYLRISNIQDEIYMLIIPELKTILKTKKLKISGRKNELISRIFDNFSEKELQIYSKGKYYVLTTLGKTIINENEIYILNKDVPYPYPIELLKTTKDKLKIINPNISDKEILYYITCRETDHLLKEKNYFRLRSHLIYEAETSLKLGYSTNSLISYIQILTLDISGCSELSKETSNGIQRYERIQLFPIFLTNIRQVIIASNISSDNLNELITKIVNKIINQLPFSYFKSENIILIIKEYINGNIIDFSKVKPDNQFYIGNDKIDTRRMRSFHQYIYGN